jgi:hypothetical protein
MKKKNILLLIIPMLCIVGLSSCLKNKNDQPDFSGTTPVVELPVNSPMGDGSVNSLSTTLVQADTAAKYLFYVNYAASSTKATDITVTLNISPASIDNYNAAHSGDPKLTILPANTFTMPVTVTIPAGERRAQVPVTFTSNLLNPNLTYGLPVTITDASGEVISKNFASLVVKVSVRNRYDGVYSYKGSTFKEGDTTKTGNFSGLTSSLSSNGNTGLNFSPVWSDGTAIENIGALTINIDPATNKVTMKSTDASTALANDPAYDNRYDPKTRTLYLSYKSGISPNSMSTIDTLSYTKPR